MNCCTEFTARFGSQQGRRAV